MTYPARPRMFSAAFKSRQKCIAHELESNGNLRFERVGDTRVCVCRKLNDFARKLVASIRISFTHDIHVVLDIFILACRAVAVEESFM